MNFLTPIYEQINLQDDNSTKKGTFYSLLNYLVANDDSQSGVKKKDLEERFSLRKDYINIIDLLVKNKALEDNDNSYKLKNEAKLFISPLLQNLLNILYKDKYNTNCNYQSDNSCTDSTPYKLLLDCRSQLFSS